MSKSTISSDIYCSSGQIIHEKYKFKMKGCWCKVVEDYQPDQ